MAIWQQRNLPAGMCPRQLIFIHRMEGIHQVEGISFVFCIIQFDIDTCMYYRRLILRSLDPSMIHSWLLSSVLLFVHLALSTAKCIDGTDPVAQSDLRNCHWYSDSACCSNDSFDPNADGFPVENPCKTLSDGCRDQLNLLTCFQCNPDQEQYYEPPKVCYDKGLDHCCSLHQRT